VRAFDCSAAGVESLNLTSSLAAPACDDADEAAPLALVATADSASGPDRPEAAAAMTRTKVNAVANTNG
jgi:hypothetical protein